MGPVSILSIGVLIVVLGIIALRWHPFIALVIAALVVAALTPSELIFRAQLSPEAEVALESSDTSASPEIHREIASAREKADTWFVSRVTSALGEGCGKLALIIAMASVIGKCLLDSGAARRIVDSLMRRLGLSGTPIAFSLSAFTLGIPVFFDTVFYLLMPLGKALRRQTGKDYLLYILTIVAGATMAHSLVPPTPGPLTVAGFFGDDVSVGSMMLGGLVVGLFTVSAGIGYAYWANRKWEIPLRKTDLEELEELPSELPSLWLSLLPIVLPVLLIGGQTILKMNGQDIAAMKFLGDKNIALILSAAAAIGLLVYSKRKEGKANVRAAMQDALSSAGVIILITSAGSAFGSVLKDTGIAMTIGSAIEGSPSLLLIPVAYAITALVRTAQGSATVAMITAGGLIAPIASEFDLSYSPLYLALAIGCGSKPISWANDSGFWIIGRISGMTPLETFKTVSVMMIIMSFVGLIVTLLGAILLPLV